ncbi:MAG: MarR family transcriptional regulator [Bacteroidia bacterium]|nr:MarR family transcriptional regulator [Bacteroidia bacterium]
MHTTHKYGSKADKALNLWIKLARAYSVFNKASVHDIRGFGLTQPQFGALECLGHLGPMTIGELSRKMLVSGGNMTCVVDNLEKEGLVQRSTDMSDRRSVIVELTEKGIRTFEEIFPRHAEFVADVAAVLNEEEQEQLALLLKKLGTNIHY